MDLRVGIGVGTLVGIDLRGGTVVDKLGGLRVGTGVGNLVGLGVGTGEAPSLGPLVDTGVGLSLGPLAGTLVGTGVGLSTERPRLCRLVGIGARTRVGIHVGPRAVIRVGDVPNPRNLSMLLVCHDKRQKEDKRVGSVQCGKTKLTK